MRLGILLAVVSAVCFNTSFVLEKRALHHLPEIHATRTLHMARTLLSSPLWLCGFAMSLFALGCQVLALSRAPLSVVQPVITAGIVVLLLLSRIMLKERLGSLEWLGIALVLVAIVMVGLSLDTTSEEVGTQGTFLRIAAAAVPTAGLAALAFLAANRRERGTAPLFGLAAGLVYGVAGVATKAVSVVVEDKGLLRAVPEVLTSPNLYLLLAFAASGLVTFQTGLQRGRASVVVPVSNVVSTAYPIGVGMVLFGEHFPRETWRLVLRGVGFAGVLVGTFLLASGHALEAAYATEPEEPVELELQAAAAGS